jgi:hypothetical protein
MIAFHTMVVCLLANRLDIIGVEYLLLSILPTLDLLSLL